MTSLWEIKDLIQYIFEFVFISDLFGLEIVCKLWKSILDKESFWQKKVFLQCPELDLMNSKSNISWKKWAKKRWNNSLSKHKRIDFMEMKNENAFSVSNESKKYRDFLIYGTIVYDLSWWNRGKLEILSLSGIEYKFDFWHNDTDQSSDDGQEFDSYTLELESDDETLKIITRNEINYQDIEHIFDILGFPKTFSFELFAKQLYYICTNKI